MALIVTDNQHYFNIASAIRQKNGSNTTLTPAEMAAAIRELTGGDVPYIGTNGNWWVGETDTGVYAQGPVGLTGPQGIQGPQGEQGPKGEAAAASCIFRTDEIFTPQISTHCSKSNIISTTGEIAQTLMDSIKNNGGLAYLLDGHANLFTLDLSGERDGYMPISYIAGLETDPLVVTVTDDGDGYTSDYSAAKIRHDITTGREVYVLYEDTKCHHVYSNDDLTSFGFSTVSDFGSVTILIDFNGIRVHVNKFVKQPEFAGVGQILVVKSVDPNFTPDEWECVDPSIILPEVTASDAGKFMRVSSDGTWEASAIPNAEEASF